jgi:carbamoyl-phosphate synthase large subunit
LTTNNFKINVLLTAAGGRHTLGVIDCLKNNYEKRKIRIICTDAVDQPLLKFKSDGFYIVPKGNSKKFINSIEKICKIEKIDVIIPGNGDEILSISNNIELFNSKNISTTISNLESIKITMDKEKTYSELIKSKINIPKFFKVNDYSEFLSSAKKLGYPKNDICFKPSKYSQSGGSKGFRILRKINTSRKIILEYKPDSIEIDFETVKSMFKTGKKLELLIMEYLPGDEFSTYVFADKGKMLYCIPNIRQKLSQHYSFEAKTVKNKQIEKMCKIIVKKLKLDYNANIQFKRSKTGKLKLIEINPRMGGTIVLPAISGVNLPYFTVKQSLGEKIPLKKQIKETKMIRYWKELYVQDTTSFEINDKLLI